MKHECNQEKNIEAIWGKVDGFDKAIFKGNGTPSIMSQIAVMGERFSSMEKKLDSIVSLGKAIILALLSVLGATAWDMVRRYHAETASDNASSKTAKMEVIGYDY